MVVEVDYLGEKQTKTVKLIKVADLGTTAAATPEQPSAPHGPLGIRRLTTLLGQGRGIVI